MTFTGFPQRFFCNPLISLMVAAVLVSGCVSEPRGAREALLEEALQTSLADCSAHREAITAQLSQQMVLLKEQNSGLKSLEGKINTKASSSPKKATVGKVTCSSTKKSEDKLLLGQLEKVWLPNLELALNARIDTGAETASLDARNIELFERNGKRWVRFKIAHPEKGEDPIQLERKLARMVIIVQSNSPEPERRPVIKLGITIGHITQTAEFTLTNRSHLDHQALIGRNILQDVMIVDVSKKNIAPFVRPEPVADKVGAR